MHSWVWFGLGKLSLRTCIQTPIITSHSGFCTDLSEHTSPYGAPSECLKSTPGKSNLIQKTRGRFNYKQLVSDKTKWKLWRINKFHAVREKETTPNQKLPVLPSLLSDIKQEERILVTFPTRHIWEWRPYKETAAILTVLFEMFAELARVPKTG